MKINTFAFPLNIDSNEGDWFIEKMLKLSQLSIYFLLQHKESLLKMPEFIISSFVAEGMQINSKPHVEGRIPLYLEHVNRSSSTFIAQSPIYIN